MNIDNLEKEIAERKYEFFIRINKNEGDGLEKRVYTFGELFVLAENGLNDRKKQSASLLGISETDEGSILDRLKEEQDYIFRCKSNTPNISTEPRISQNQVGKSIRRFTYASDTMTTINGLIYRTASEIQANSPGYSSNTFMQVARTVIGLADLGVIRSGTEADVIKRLVLGIEDTGAPSFGCFVCAPTDLSYLDSNSAASYLRTNLSGSLLEGQLPEIRKIITNIQRLGIQSNFLALVGDNDEAEYLDPILNILNDINPAELDGRRSVLARNIFAALNGFVDADDLRVLSLGLERDVPTIAIEAYERILKNPLVAFTESDIQEEMGRLRELFSPNNYYAGLIQYMRTYPEESQLREIVRYKFATYAMQGVQAYSMNPNLILMRTEWPEALRNKMLNAGLSLLKLPTIPSIYPNLRRK